MFGLECASRQFHHGIGVPGLGCFPEPAVGLSRVAVLMVQRRKHVHRLSDIDPTHVRLLPGPLSSKAHLPDVVERNAKEDASVTKIPNLYLKWSVFRGLMRTTRPDARTARKILGDTDEAPILFSKMLKGDVGLRPDIASALAKVMNADIDIYRSERKLSGPGSRVSAGDPYDGVYEFAKRLIRAAGILDAIDYCVGARRNIQFTDADFHGLDVEQPIQISVTIGELDDALKNMELYGLYVRGFDVQSGEIEDEPEKDAETVLTVRLTIAGDLEPVWSLVSDRADAQGQVRALNWGDRVRIAPTRIGVMADYHLAWGRGSVLNRIPRSAPTRRPRSRKRHAMRGRPLETRRRISSGIRSRSLRRRPRSWASWLEPASGRCWTPTRCRSPAGRSPCTMKREFHYGALASARRGCSLRASSARLHPKAAFS
jgi:hypothetical protein